MYYTWGDWDSIWTVAGNLDRLTAAGWADTDTFVQQIEAANPQILDWAAVSPGTLVYLPFVHS